jgi:hypothetical protein
MQDQQNDSPTLSAICVVCPFCPTSSPVVFFDRRQLLKHNNSMLDHPSNGDVPLVLEEVRAVKALHGSRVKWIRAAAPLQATDLPRFVLFQKCVCYNCQLLM